MKTEYHTPEKKEVDPVLTPRHLHVSRGITKLGQSIPSVSLPPVITCRADAPCARVCYARKGRFRFTHNMELLQNNLDLWHEDPEGFERDLTIAAYTSRFFRYHSAGDIPDDAYLAMMVRVADACPGTGFLCFTKKFELVNRYIAQSGMLPSNLNMVFSAWGSFLPENPWGLPVAYIRFRKGENHIPDNARQCSGYCGECVQTGCSCWDLRRGCSDCVVFNQH